MNKIINDSSATIGHNYDTFSTDLNDLYSGLHDTVEDINGIDKDLQRMYRKIHQLTWRYRK